MAERRLLLIILGLPILLFGLSAARAVQLAAEGEVPAELRDLNCDGKVSPIEWLRGGIDFRLRPGDEGCQEIYFVKTGAPAVVRCGQSCRVVR
jgi:hypothetical protein